MRSAEDVALVHSLLAEGLNDCEVSRRTGIPRSTVREWRSRPRSRARRQSGCPECGHPVHDPALLPTDDYAYLLGLYLGDGCISPHRRGVFNLRITLDVRYPLIIEACRAAVAEVIGKRPGLTPQAGCVQVSSWSKQWPCLFPQHGPGRKHQRPIELADWQQAIVD